MRKLLGLILLGLITALVGPHVYRYVRFLGYHLAGDIQNIHPGECWTIPGLEQGSEDFELLPNGKVMITVGALYPPGLPAPEGHNPGIYILDLNETRPVPTALQIKGDLDLKAFRPLGISKWINKEANKITILVVNIRLRGFVERFVYSEPENTLYHIETLGIDDPNFFIVDDIAATGERSFYYTNLHGEHAHWEMRTFLPWGSVGHYDGRQSTLVDEGCAAPNGIFLSPDGRYLYVLMIGDQELRVYARHKDNTVEYLNDNHVGLMDNVMVTDDGDLWMAGPIIGYKALELMATNTGASPSIVRHATMKEGVMTDIEDVFIDDGHLISGVSVGVVVKLSPFCGICLGATWELWRNIFSLLKPI